MVGEASKEPKVRKITKSRIFAQDLREEINNLMLHVYRVWGDVRNLACTSVNHLLTG